MKIKDTIKRIPLVKYFIEHYKIWNQNIEYKRLLQDTFTIDNRIKAKVQNHEKINITFICYRPAVWGSLKTVYESLLKNQLFNVNIVSIPKMSFDRSHIESEGAEEYFEKYNAIKGFSNGKYFDLKALNPDFVFYQQPYNLVLPNEYQSSIVAKYARICYIDYFSFNDNVKSFDVFYGCVPKDFMKSVSLYFVQSDIERELISKWMEDTPNIVKYIKAGYPKYDNVDSLKGAESNIWHSRNGMFRIIWTPRWCTNENNCHFFLYKDKFLEFVKSNKQIDFIFRPHPQSWFEWNRTGEFTFDQANQYKAKYDEIVNAQIDNSKEYLKMFYSSDCLVTDLSTIIPEYLLTGKPIIYCDSYDSKHGYLKDKGYGKSFYWAYTWEDVENYINMLISGSDPKREERERYIKSDFFLGGKTAGDLITESIIEFVMKR